MEVNNGWLDEDEEWLNNDEEEYDINDVTPNTKPNNNMNNELNSNTKPKSDYVFLEETQRELANKLERIQNSNIDDKDILEKTKRLENLIVEIENTKEELEKIGPDATFEDLKKFKAEESQLSGGRDKPKTLVLSNPNGPKTPMIDDNFQSSAAKGQDSFFKTFIYTTLIGGALMGTYLSFLL